LKIEAKNFDTYSESLSLAGADVERSVKLNLETATESVQITSDGPVRSSTPRQRMTASRPRSPQCSSESLDRHQGGQVARPSKTVNVVPIYTEEAWESGRDGSTRLAAVISRKGELEDIRVMETSHPGFAREAVTVMRLWRFTPRYLNCTPVETE